MKLTHLTPSRIDLSVSRRNLLTLFAKLANAHSARMVGAQCTDPLGARYPVWVTLHAEPNEEHYADRPARPMEYAIDGRAVIQLAMDLIEQVQKGTDLTHFDDGTFEKSLHQLAYLRDRVAHEPTLVV